MQVEIQKSFINHVYFDKFTSKESIDGIYNVACQNVPVEYWKEYDPLNDFFTIEASTQDDLEEKTLDLITFVESFTHNCIIMHDGSRKGFNIKELRDKYSEYIRDFVNYGGKDKYNGSNNFVKEYLPASYFVVEYSELAEELGEPIVYFYMNKKDVMVGEEGTEEELKEKFDFLTASEHCYYPLNSYGFPIGIEENPYGEIIQLPLSIATQFIDITY